MSRTTSKAVTTTTITPASILASMLRADGADTLGTLLPRVEPHLPALVAAGVDTMAVNDLARDLVVQRDGGGHARARQALEAAGAPHHLLDALDDVTFAELDHVFAFGLALGLRMGRG